MGSVLLGGSKCSSLFIIRYEYCSVTHLDVTNKAFVTAQSLPMDVWMYRMRWGIWVQDMKWGWYYSDDMDNS